MSGYFDNYSDDFDAEERGGQSGSGLRAQLEQALAAISELREELSTERRTSAVTGLLKEKGKDPAVAGLIPKDADPQKWLDDFGHLLKDAGEKVEQPTPEVAEPNPELVAEQSALQQMDQVQPTGTSTVAPTPEEILAGFKSEAEFLDFLAKQGGHD